jgi:hypothetical protein
MISFYHLGLRPLFCAQNLALGTSCHCCQLLPKGVATNKVIRTVRMIIIIALYIIICNIYIFNFIYLIIDSYKRVFFFI